MSEADPAALMRFVLDMREAGVTDLKTLSALERTDRAHFAPEHLRALALEDVALPLAHGQSMSKPSVVGRMISALDPKPGDLVLEVGTGSGFQAAALAAMARKVTTLDRHRDLVADARARFGALRLMNVQAHLADGRAGWAEGAPYDRIIVNGAVDSVPAVLIDQLAEEGVIVAPVIEDGRARLKRFEKKEGALGSGMTLGPIEVAALEEGVAEDQQP
ncbi:MAG: protein-L-isoaspartate(D-aspartate) O-methyltransferase [Hyphomonadaceae bacterium]